MIDGEEVEIHILDDVGGRGRFGGGIDVIVAAGEHQRREQGGQKEADSQSSILHDDHLWAITNDIRPQRLKAQTHPRLAPWAAFLRCFAAEARNLCSIAKPRKSSSHALKSCVTATPKSVKAMPF
jgi:hypothetical protein